MYCRDRWKPHEGFRESKPAFETRGFESTRHSADEKLTAISFSFISILSLTRSRKNEISNISQSNRRVMKLMVIAASSKHSGVSSTFCKLISFGVNFLDFRTMVRCVPLASFSEFSGSRLFKQKTKACATSGRDRSVNLGFLLELFGVCLRFKNGCTQMTFSNWICNKLSICRCLSLTAIQR